LGVLLDLKDNATAGLDRFGASLKHAHGVAASAVMLSLMPAAASTLKSPSANAEPAPGGRCETCAPERTRFAELGLELPSPPAVMRAACSADPERTHDAAQVGADVGHHLARVLQRRRGAA
jgi:hypothetical protein